MHDFNPGHRTPSRPKRLESQHRPHLPFHGTVILLHAIIEILALPNSNAGLVGPVVVLNRRRVTATLVNGDLLGKSLVPNRFT